MGPAFYYVIEVPPTTSSRLRSKLQKLLFLFARLVIGLIDWLIDWLKVGRFSCCCFFFSQAVLCCSKWSITWFLVRLQWNVGDQMCSVDAFGMSLLYWWKQDRQNWKSFVMCSCQRLTKGGRGERDIKRQKMIFLCGIKEILLLPRWIFALNFHFR